MIATTKMYGTFYAWEDPFDLGHPIGSGLTEEEAIEQLKYMINEDLETSTD